VGCEILHHQERIFSLIPHRPPFLWVDRILECHPHRIVTEKRIDTDEPCLAGHFPGYPLFPGALLCEAIFQSGAMLMGELNKKNGNLSGELPLLTRIREAKFKKPVFPGDIIVMSVTLLENTANAYFFHGVARVRDKIAVTVDFACMLQKSAP
jgi:3-hydroxyacyl-[acyl-carrier-protein] dehydratase